MARFTTLVPTAVGKELQAKLIATGQAISITRIKVGSGELDDGDDMRQFTDLKNEVVDADITITNKTYDSSGNLIIEIQLKCSETAYTLREISLWINNPFAATNTMLSYAHSIGNGDEIPAQSESAYVTYITLVVPQGGADVQVSVDIETGVSRRVFDAHVKDFNDHVDDKSNPHGVVFSQTVETLGSAADLNNIKDGLYRYPVNTANAPTTDEGLLMQETSASGVSFQTAIKAAQEAVEIYQRYMHIPIGETEYEWTSWVSAFHSPAFTGVPTAPTAEAGTNTTQIATTAFVAAAIAAIVIPEDQSQYAHTHTNKTILDSITQNVIDYCHTHSNKTALDAITSTKVSNWNSAYSNSHTHSNKTALDAITSTKVSNWNSAYSHTSDTDNPHGVDCEQIGAAPAAHEHSNYAPKNSPSFSGAPTAPTPANSDNSTRVSTTAFVKSAIESALSEILDYIDITVAVRFTSGSPGTWTITSSSGSWHFSGSTNIYVEQNTATDEFDEQMYLYGYVSNGEAYIGVSVSGNTYNQFILIHSGGTYTLRLYKFTI